MSGNINWAVIGTGVIANEMAVALNNAGKKIYSVANRTYEKGEAFCRKYGISKLYRQIDDVFQDENVDCIYITTPHNTHYEFMKKACLAGKHIFVEKSITLNSAELDDILKLAKQNNVIVGEAMTIYHMPVYNELVKIVESGELGAVQLIAVNFGSYKDYDMTNRFFNINLAGGALLDIGVYALALVRTFFSSNPDNVLSQVRKAVTGTDEIDSIIASNSEGQMATIALSMHSKQPKRAIISCEKAYIEIMEFPRAFRATIIDAATGEKREIVSGDSSRALEYELSDFEEAVKSGNTEALKLDYSVDVMKIMTDLRKEWNLVYPEEKC